MSARNNDEYDCQPTTEKSCDDWILKTGETIGEESAHGKVYIACRDLYKKDCPYVLKLVLGRYETDKVRHEVQMQNLCATKDFCMPVVDWWIHQDPTDRNRSKDFGIIITGLLRESVRNVLLRSLKDPNYSWELIKRTLTFIYNFHQNGMYHGDSHLGNIMFTHEGQLKFIDTDTTGTFSDLFQDKEKSDFFEEAIYEDYSQFGEGGLELVVMDGRIHMDAETLTFYRKLIRIIEYQIVAPIVKNDSKQGENRVYYLDRLRNLEYKNLNKLLAMSIDDIVHQQVDQNSNDLLPVTTQKLITSPVPSIEFYKGESPIEPFTPEPVSVEILGQPRDSVASLVLDFPEEDGEPEITILGNMGDIFTALNE